MRKFFKYFLILILLLIPVNNVFSQNCDDSGIVFKQGVYKVNAINPTSASGISSYYPGLRGPNQMIVYTKFGERTGTNEFGTEAIVIDGIVVQLNGADSIIPQNGFVISGHGSAKKWINENLAVGTQIVLDATNKEIKYFITPESFIFATKEKIEETYSIIGYYMKDDLYYSQDKPLRQIKKAKEYLKNAIKNPSEVQKYSAQAMKYANSALEVAIPYRDNELKGVWIRPTETNQRDIEKTIENIKEMGIDNIFLETYFHGKTIFKSDTLEKYGVTSQREEFCGFDPLRIWIKEAHNRDMKIHIWFETFYVGNDNPQCIPNHILTKYPSWGNVTKKQYDSNIPVASLSEHNGYFIDPANPEVQIFLTELLNEIIIKYDIDGINLDYIRYPQSIALKFPNYEDNNWGYTQFARDEFNNIYGHDPLDIEKNTPEWDLWAKYRQNKINEFVAKSSKMIKDKKIFLSTVIFPDRTKNLETKMQDWRNWSLNGYVDALTPLILTCDKDSAKSLIKDIKKNSSTKTKIYPGLFVPFMNGSSEDLLRQIHQSRTLKVNGIVMFDYNHMSEKYINALLTSVFNKSCERKYVQSDFSSYNRNKK